MDENKKPPRKLLDNRVLDFRIVSSFLLTIFIILLFMILVLHNIVPRTSINVYWENDRSPNKVVLPGMNASYNLVLENEGGPLTFTNVIIEMDREGNWSVSSREVIVKPNERKIITFTNHVPLNATEGIYHYDFWLVGMIDEGPKYGHGPIQISTEVTIDMDYFNASQSTSSSIFSHLSGGSYPSTFYLYIISPLTLGIFITWIVLCIIFFKRKNLPQTRNICKN